ncbi:unnamed protein product [Gordionus sp. m RMFG-2023]|uniref:fumarylacetoacetase-like n=1 Tax=Gordionus sp. m RMFG-2023 TaxID=3053472 RepID=UPI0030DE92FF
MKSFINYSKDTDFPIENLPYGIFSTKDDPKHRIGVAIGDFVLDLSKISHLFNGPLLKDKQDAFKQSVLNSFMELNHEAWTEARKLLQHILSAKTNPADMEIENFIKEKALTKISECQMHLPARIGDYTDFYCSRGHANNMGKLFRGKDNELPPNWLHLPVGYHGRASSVIVSSTPVTRPNGQTQPANDKPPIFGPSSKLDIELEMALFVGGPENPLGKPIPISEAHKRIFGLVLMNDWSARDIQKWEYFPLGPFLGKSFGTSISPWIITIDALRPFIVPNVVQDPEAMPYLRHADAFNFNVDLEILYKTPKMEKPELLSTPNMSKHLYWNIKQMLTHHASNGCNLRAGDLMGTGTISGNDPKEFGSLVELSWNGTRPIDLKTKDGADSRCFLQDGDEIILRGHCHNEEYRIGFGECAGKILPAPPQ